MHAADELADLAREEVHKPIYETWTGEIIPLAAALRWHEKNLRRLLRPRRLRGTPFYLLGSSHRVLRAPLGRVAIIATWNYPIQLLGIQLAQAVAAGNRVIAKPSEYAPRTQRRLLELAAADLPHGVLTTARAEREAGRELLQSEPLDHVLFTGSTAVGRSIAADLAPSLTASTLELSGRDSAFVLDDADPDLAARVLAFAVRLNAGQTCMAPRRALVLEPVYDRFVAALERLACEEAPRTLISPDAARHVRSLVDGAVALGARVLASAPTDFEGKSGAESASTVMTPTFVADCPADADLVTGDHFGPALAVVRCRDLDHALSVHRRCDQHLTAMVFTSSGGRAADLAPRLGASNVMVNDAVVPFSHPAATLAGHGASGWGPSQGAAGLLAMTREVHFSRTPKRPRPPTAPPSERDVTMLKRIARFLYAGKLPTQRRGELHDWPPLASRPSTTATLVPSSKFSSSTAPASQHAADSSPNQLTEHAAR